MKNIKFKKNDINLILDSLNFLMEIMKISLIYNEVSKIELLNSKIKKVSDWYNFNENYKNHIDFYNKFIISNFIKKNDLDYKTSIKSTKEK